MKKLIGKISIHTRGFGFVTPQNDSHEDVFIPSSKMKGAIDGDIVEIQVLSKSKKGFEGCILRIKERGRTHLVGTVIELLPKGDAIIFAPVVGEDRRILLKKSDSEIWKIGDRISMEIQKATDDAIICKFDELLGNIENALVDTKIAIAEFQLTKEFPKEVVQSAKALPATLKADPTRTDLRMEECITIDPVTARDYDDALSLKKDEKGHYHLGVHIADVSHFVTEDSPLDKEAFARANSTYFVDDVVPMLPEELSNELCSLKEGVLRYTVSVLAEFDPEGEVLHYKIVKGMIESRKRLTYEGAKEILDGKKESPLEPLLKLLVELYSHLKKKRRARGSVDLALPEVRLLLGEDGVPNGQQTIEYDITHQLVEEFMLFANETVSKHLEDNGQRSIFRIHEEPDAEIMKEFFSYARLLGFRIPPNPKEADIQALFEQASDSIFVEQLAVRYIRSMKLAIYSKDNIGHYGLALEYYTHFTSPIRRYSDLVIHRLLFDANYKPDLDAIAEQCSLRERLSFKAEMSVLKLKKLRYLDKLAAEEPDRIFEATVTTIKSQGLSFDLDFLGFEGFIHISDVCSDFLVFNEATSTLVGNKTGITFHIGKKIHVKLEMLNLIFRDATWSVANAHP